MTQDIPKADRPYIKGDRACWAPGALFLKNFDSLSLEIQRVLPEGGLGCAGEGRPGYWCRGCPWFEEMYTREWFDK